MTTTLHPLFLSTKAQRDARSRLEVLEDMCHALYAMADEDARVGARFAQRWLDTHSVESQSAVKREAKWEHGDTTVDAIALAQAVGY